MADTVRFIRQVTVIDDGKDAWNESTAAGVTSTTITGTPGIPDGVNGSTCVLLTMDATVAAGAILATEVVSTTIIWDYLYVWVRATINVAANQLQFLLDNNANCASPHETLNVPALTANVWKRLELPFANPFSSTSVISIGVKQVSDLGAFSLSIYDVRQGAAYTFDVLSVRGVENPDEIERFPDIEEKILLNGSIYENDLFYRRIITIQLAQTEPDQSENIQYLNDWFYQWTDKEIIYNGLGVYVARGADTIETEWYEGFVRTKLMTIRLSEKTIWGPSNQEPPGWHQW